MLRLYLFTVVPYKWVFFLLTKTNFKCFVDRRQGRKGVEVGPRRHQPRSHRHVVYPDGADARGLRPQARTTQQIKSA
jgi:hypothetical protein